MSGNIDWHEINRKIFHILFGIIIALLVYYDAISAWGVLLFIGFGIIISIVSTFYDIPVITYFLNRFEREHLRKKFPGKGVIYFFLGLLFMMLTFEKSIVMAAIMIWIFGDSVSAIIGKNFGKIVHPLNYARLIEGTIAGIIAASLAASLFVYWPYAIIGATITLGIESIEWKLYRETFDDNFFVPVIGAAAIYLMTIIF